MLTRSPRRTRLGETRTVTPRPLAAARTTVASPVCLATTVPVIVFVAAVADPTATRRAATARSAVHFIDDFSFSLNWRPLSAVFNEVETRGAKKSRPATQPPWPPPSSLEPDEPDPPSGLEPDPPSCPPPSSEPACTICVLVVVVVVVVVSPEPEEELLSPPSRPRLSVAG
jgi:hypothetical protein